jgi:hypothetical protein
MPKINEMRTLGWEGTSISMEVMMMRFSMMRTLKIQGPRFGRITISQAPSRNGKNSPYFL